MGRTGIAKASKLLFRDSKQFQARSISKTTKSNQILRSEDSINKNTTVNKDSVCWVPHPRTGIFFPAGQEAVMDGVPDGAASFDVTFWLRNVDGVDKADHDLPLGSNNINAFDFN